MSDNQAGAPVRIDSADEIIANVNSWNTRRVRFQFVRSDASFLRDEDGNGIIESSEFLIRQAIMGLPGQIEVVGLPN